MGHMEQMGGKLHSPEELQAARNFAQIQIAFEENEALIPWIEKHAGEFDEITKREPRLLDDLAEEDTRREAIQRIKKEIYH